MKMTAFILFLGFLHVSGKGFTQTVTLSLKNAPIEKAFKEIKKQTGYEFLYTDEILNKSIPVTIKVKNETLLDVLKACFSNQPIDYTIIEKTIVVKAKEEQVITPAFFFPPPPIDIHGRVVDEKGQPVAGVTVKVKGSKNATSTNDNGEFSLMSVDENGTLQFTSINMEPFEIQVNGKTDLAISLKTKFTSLGDVNVQVNTGYQTIPKERATGSFVQIDNSLLNRRVGTNILDRLEGITSGLVFNAGNIYNGTRMSNELTGITIRGRSSIDEKVSADPLIVLDNFPYDGDIGSINPNDVESITVLKDAAAASIWGARSGNGVIVITTKKGRTNQKMKIELNSNVTVGDKPDLFYSKNFISSPDFINLETLLFNNGYLMMILIRSISLYFLLLLKYY